AQYAKAEPLYLEALKINREVLGNKHRDTAGNIFNLANIYTIQAQYAKAEPLLLEALKIRREVLGDKHDDTATSIGSLATLYLAQAQYAKAEEYCLEALKICREVLGNKHLSTAAIINNLANLYQAQAQYAKAEPLYLEALKMLREAFGDKHPDTAMNISNLANLYQAQAQYAKAEPLFIESLKIKREILGNKHPDTARTINNLANLYSNQVQYAKAEPLYLEALKILTANLQAISIIQSENAQILMANNSKFFLNNFLTNALAYNSLGGGYDQVLSWKGMIYRRQNLLRALQGNDPLKKELSDTIRQLATLLNSTPKPNEEQEFQDKVKALSEKKEDLEKDLAKQIPTLNLAKVTPADLQNLIAPDAALVDIFQYEHSSPPKEGQREQVFENRYAAWVIRKDKPIVRLELGSAEGLNNLVLQWRSSIATRKSPSEGPQDPAIAIREKVWLPIAKHLEGAKTVIISPDGMLGTLPFTALPGEDIKNYLIEERNIAVVPFLQTLPDLLAKKELAGKNLLAVGDVAYDAEPGSGSLLAKTALRGNNTMKWNPLDGTRAEMVAIRDSFEQKFPDAKSMQLRKAQATEEAFRQQAPKANFLHIATHGFFVEAAPLTTDSKNSAKIDNPGLQSGLALAGANQPLQAGLDDGILTASEVAELDLTGVEQAVLSACETGLGKSLAGEGLLGLQRAFQLAGARTVVASMWKVPDLATKELMTRFWSELR
ncbi:MAG: CHAT domain-containing protein, partial [Planctomycetota bacterium]